MLTQLILLLKNYVAKHKNLTFASVFHGIRFKVRRLFVVMTDNFFAPTEIYTGIIMYFCNMVRVYKSKVSKWFLWTCIILGAAFVGSLVLCYRSTWVLLIDVVFSGVCIALMLDILLHTDYTIEEDTLYIRCGIMFRMRLPISRIIEITHKSTVLSSPALSAKRIGIKYGRRSWVYVSPQDQEDFISYLKSINPAIIVS